MSTPILAVARRRTNADLIADCVALGYLHEDWHTLDPTYGHGAFWQRWRPKELTACDIDPAKSPIGRVDVRALPWLARTFDCVVFDPPYKLNGTPDPGMDRRYGVHESTTWRDRLLLIQRGLAECARVLSGGYLLVKCQDQVCSGKVRWQTTLVAETAEHCGLGLVDRFDMLSYRPQPAGRHQVHARRNTSSLLVFKRDWKWRP
jgi:hypothetical protein